MWLPNASGSFHLTVVCRCIIMIMRLDKTEFLMYNRNRTFVRNKAVSELFTGKAPGAVRTVSKVRRREIVTGKSRNMSTKSTL